jgi:hypothetical protein
MSSLFAWCSWLGASSVHTDESKNHKESKGVVANLNLGQGGPCLHWLSQSAGPDTRNVMYSFPNVVCTHLIFCRLGRLALACRFLLLSLLCLHR